MVIGGTCWMSMSSTTTVSDRTRGKSNLSLGDRKPSADAVTDVEVTEEPVPPRGECREWLSGLLQHDRRAA